MGAGVLGEGGVGPIGTIGATGTIGITGGVIGRPVDGVCPASRLVPRIELLVVQPTPFCNIDCRYCYLPDRNSKAVVARETLANLFSQVFASGWVGECLSVVWHAGEPMVLPIAFYRDAFQMIDRLKPANLTVVHSFQTNGTLIGEAWCDFFTDHHVNLGVSIDGPRQFHDCNRLTRSGKGTFDRTIAGIRLLRQRAVPFHVISVLSEASMAAPQEMFGFYVEEGIERAESDARGRLEVAFVDFERRQTERIERVLSRELERHVQAAALAFDERMRELKEDAAARLARELERAVELLGREELMRRVDTETTARGSVHTRS